MLGLSLAAGCGKYSCSTLKAEKAFKDGNDRYAAEGLEGGRRRSTRQALAERPRPRREAYFFLGNSYDNLYKPASKGEPENDAYIQKAIDELPEGRRAGHRTRR